MGITDPINRQLNVEKGLPMDHSTARARRMIELMKQLAPLEGYNLSPLDDIRFLRSNRPLTRTPVLYEPGIVILCQGRKRGYLGEDVYVSDARHYLKIMDISKNAEYLDRWKDTPARRDFVPGPRLQ